MHAFSQFRFKPAITAALCLLINIFYFVEKMPAPITVEPESTPNSVKIRPRYPKSLPKPSPSALRVAESPAKNYYDRSSEKIKTGDWEGGVSDLTEAIRLSPSYADAYFARGICEQTLKRYDKALNDFTEAIRLRPRYVQVYWVRSGMYALLEKYAEEIADVTEIIRLTPNDAYAYCARANIFSLNLKQFDRAVVDYTAAIRCKPDDGNLYLDRAFSYERLGDSGDAERDREKARQLGVKDWNLRSQ